MSKERLKFPNSQNLKRTRRDLERSKGSYILPPNANALDRAKYEMCRQILLYMKRKEISQRELAQIMAVPETRVSEIVHYRIWKFTLDRLLNYFERLKPNVVLKVA